MSVCRVCCPIKDVDWCYLGTDVFKGGWADKRKADQEHILKKTKDIKQTAATLTFPIGTQVIKYDMDFSFPPCESLAKRPVCCKDKGADTELFHFLQQASRQSIGTMDTRLCSVHALHRTNERQRENSLHGDAVTLKLTGLQLHLLRLHQSLCMRTYGLWVRQRPESVIVLLSRCVPQAQVYWFPINHHIGRVIVKAVREYAEMLHSFSIPRSVRGVSARVVLTLWGCTRQGRHS